MTPPPGWRRIFRHLESPRAIQRDVDDELSFHLAMREEKLRRAGLSTDDAHAIAHERFGDAGRERDELLIIARQHARERRLMDWIEAVWSEFCFALRSLRGVSIFSSVASSSLAFGFGATTEMFT